MPSRCYVATAQDEGMRLDALMGERGLYPSRSAAAHAIEDGKVLAAGKPATKKTKVHVGLAIVY